MADPTTANPDGLFGIPGGAEVWQSPDNQWYVVYKIPETGTPLAWHLESLDDIAKVFGDADPTPTRVLNEQEWNSAGLLLWGTSRQLANLTEHPFDNWVANLRTEAQTQPWLLDPEILALNARAMLEGRSTTDAEIAGTDWFRNRTAGERDWIFQFNRDPATARQMIQDSRDSTRTLMAQLGIADPPERLVQLMADRVTGGTWTAQYMQRQLAEIADPTTPGALDPTVAIWLSDTSKAGAEPLSTTATRTGRVDELVQQWLGPKFAATWTDQQRQQWAGQLRQDPAAEEELVAELRRQRFAQFGAYDESLSYQDIAAPWRGVWTEAWGQVPDETDALFVDIVKRNDMTFAEQQLRRVGVQRGIGAVEDRILSGIGQTPLGQSTRRVM